MKAVVFTLGCKVNAYESLSLITGLKEKGFEVSDKLEPADLYIINTCAVTKEAERKSRQAVARVRKHNDKAKIIVTGCASQKSPNDFIEKEGVTLVYGAVNKDKIIELLDTQGVVIDEDESYYEKYLPCQEIKTRSFIKAQDGCNNFCSYCIIPYLRGRSRSRSIDSVINELKALKPLEAVITGINLSAYDYNGLKLADLIDRLEDIPSRIRLSSLEDNVIDDKLLKNLAKLKDFAPHFHLSLQSGSDKVLKEMNRKYTTFDYKKSVTLIREFFPNAGITTDVIVGYSTETEDDFRKTLEFCEEIGFSDIHCFEYSKREGTVGFELPSLPAEVKKERLNRILELKNKLKSDFINSQIGKTINFLCENVIDGYAEGYSANYVKVYVNSALEKGFYNVEILQPFKDGVLAKIK